MSRERVKRLTDQQKKEMTYLSLLVLSFRDNNILPELLYLLDTDVFIKLINVYSGKCIRIPSKDEILKSFQVLMYYYEVEIGHKDEKAFFKKHHITKKWPGGIRHRITKLKKQLKMTTIPKEFCKSDFLKKLQEVLWKKI